MLWRRIRIQRLPHSFLFLFHFRCHSVRISSGFGYLLSCCSYQCSGIDHHPFEFWLWMETTTVTSKVSISHLLLYQHFLDRYTRVVNSIDLSANGSALVAAGERPPSITASCSQPLTSTGCLSLSIQTASKIVMWKIFTALIPHETS